MNDWTICEWPHSRALGERWVAFPPPTPPDLPWPGLKFFNSREEAEVYAGGFDAGLRSSTSGDN